MIVLIDNYDSFVYNLARYIQELGFITEVYRNDKISIEQIIAKNPSHIILSPGPKSPKEAGICVELIQQVAPFIPILGVCLGHQAIGFAYGAKIIAAKHPKHGKAALVQHHEQRIFKGLNNPLRVGLYHSLAVSSQDLPNCLNILALSAEGDIMALEHQTYPSIGVQFHPESILTEQGHQLLFNFLNLSKPYLQSPLFGYDSCTP